MRTRTLAQVVIIGMLLALVSGGTVAQGAGEPGVVHFTAAGDFGSNNNTNAVLAGMAAAGHRPRPRARRPLVRRGGPGAGLVRLGHLADGRRLPVRAVAGTTRATARTATSTTSRPACPISCPASWAPTAGSGTSTSRRSTRSSGSSWSRRRSRSPTATWSYAAGTPRYNWTAAAIDGARSKNIPWVVVGVHKPCISVGRVHLRDRRRHHQHADQKRVDLVLNGHEHIYQRTKQLGLRHRLLHGASRLLRHRLRGRHRRRCRQGRRHGVRDVGTGRPGAAHRQHRRHRGRLLRDCLGQEPEPHQRLPRRRASPPTTSRPPSCPSRAARSPTRSRSTRAIRRPTSRPQRRSPRRPPASTGTFDGRGSTDPEGPIASYSWDFGDGTTGSGAQPSHTYATAGDYTSR